MDPKHILSMLLTYYYKQYIYIYIYMLGTYFYVFDISFDKTHLYLGKSK